MNPPKKDTPDFKGLRHSKIGYFKEVRSKIKELEKLNVQLARRHNRLEAILNSMSEGVTILDRNLSIAFSNRVQKELFPQISDASMSCHQIFYQRDEQCPDCPVLKTLETGEMLQGEHMYKKGHLAGRYFEWTTSPIIDDLGNVDETILIMRDITDRKEYEFSMMQTDRMVSVGFLATSLAHEINNPLTSIAGFSEGLLKRLKSANLPHGDKFVGSFREYLEIINSEAYRCKDIIQNLREFSSSASDDYEPVRIDLIIQDTISLIRQYAKDHRIKIIFENHLAAGLDHLTGKSSQLKHLFLNLFKRLFSVIETDGELMLAARNDGQVINITLSDPEGCLAHELRTNSNSQPLDVCFSKERWGIDLSICYDIIHHHRGKISFINGNDGDQLMLLSFPAILI